jgi:MFS family permease
MFSSLRTRNFRLFATGQIFSNTGTWVQRIAQDWLVLSLTGSATAVGITTALQFLPTLLFGLVGGLIADRYPKRQILLVTQTGMATVAGILAVLTLTHQVAAWHVYVIAFALGLVTAVDNPTRQSFANEMVGPGQLRNAISINSSVFQLGGLIGPAISGALISAVGPGYSFAINALSYAAPLTALLRMRTSELHAMPEVTARAGQLRDGLRYAVSHPAVLWPTVLAGVFGMFTCNLPVTLAAYARSVFHSGPGGYGLLSAVVAVGSIAGALISARMRRTRLRTLIVFGAVLAAIDMLSAAVPGQAMLCLLLLPIGACTLLLLTATNSTVQVAAHDTIRGRVMGIYLLVFIGGAAVGGPLLGLIDQHLSPRAGMLLAGAVPAVATALIAAKLASGRPRQRPSLRRSLTEGPEPEIGGRRERADGARVRQDQPRPRAADARRQVAPGTRPVGVDQGHRRNVVRRLASRHAQANPAHPGGGFSGSLPAPARNGPPAAPQRIHHAAGNHVGICAAGQQAGRRAGIAGPLVGTADAPAGADAVDQPVLPGLAHGCLTVTVFVFVLHLC